MSDVSEASPAGPSGPSEFAAGFFIGLLVGEGHFGGDGRQPQITLRMHLRHKGIFDWLTETFPGGRLYGPYHHGGRHYYQWMVRGPYLRGVIAPMIARHQDFLAAHVQSRFLTMCEDYRIILPDAQAAGTAAPAG